jgi:hypothetical protein
MKRLLPVAMLAMMQTALAADPRPQPIRFAAGASSATIEGAVVRGDRDLYTIGAGAGQTMTVTITALESNAAFQLYAPGARLGKDSDGILTVNGRALPGAGETDDAMRWTGRLPVGGDYLVVVGGTRGNASYRLTVAIK